MYCLIWELLRNNYIYDTDIMYESRVSEVFVMTKKLENPDADLSNVHFYVLLLNIERNIEENKQIYVSNFNNFKYKHDIHQRRSYKVSKNFSKYGKTFSSNLICTNMYIQYASVSMRIT